MPGSELAPEFTSKSESARPLWWAWGLVSLWLLASLLLTPVYAPLQWALLGLLGLLFLALGLGSAWLCTCLMSLTLYTGILTAAPVGFTLKGPQIFALLGLAAWGLSVLRRGPVKLLPLKWWLPFVLFGLCILPSLLVVERSQLALGVSETSLRLLFNYAWLQLFFLLLLLEAQDLQRIRHLLGLSMLSLALSLAFGYAQQIAFYLGFYDPFQFVGRHSSIVDFYGPFLRFSPGTFANEYGEILQTCGILLVGWLCFLPERRFKALATGLLIAVGLALVLNFTRASWLVFAFGSFCLLCLARVRFSRLLLALGLGGSLLAVLLYLSQLILNASLLLSLGKRFQELGQLQTSSAGSRLQTWHLAWEAFLQSPWLGHGWGRFVETHNVPLQLLAETGLLGALGFYALMLWCSWQMLQAWWRALDPRLKGLQVTLLMAFWGCLAFDLTNHGIYHFVLWFVLALGLATARCVEAEGADAEQTT